MRSHLGCTLTYVCLFKQNSCDSLLGIKRDRVHKNDSEKRGGLDQVLRADLKKNECITKMHDVNRIK